MVIDAKSSLISQGKKPSALNIVKEIGCSKKQLYHRKDLRPLVRETYKG